MKYLSHLVVLLAVSGTAPADDSLCVAKDGSTDYVITIAASPTAVQSTAARELQEHLAAVTGVKLKIVAENDIPPDARQIVVGPSKRLKQLLPDLDVDALGHDGIVMKTVGKDIVLAGRAPRGVLNAVYTFLEDVVGCRWWTSEESYVPKKPTLTIPALDVAYAPPLRYREAYYRDALNGVFAARQKCNGHACRIPPEYGGHYRFAGFVHTFYPLLPPAKYFAEHPEWYSLIKGKRTTDRAQLCLTNEEMRKELVRNAIARLRKDPAAGIISISQNDWRNPCQCERCRAVVKEEGSESGPVLRFVNAVAEDIEKEFPDVLVETLAYQYTRKPPLHVKPRRNVIVRLCSIECSFVQPLGEGTQNEKFRGDIEGWSKIASQLFVWNYVTNFSNYILPHPNMRVLAPNLRFFVDHKVVGLFEQGDSQCSVGDFVRLRAWLLAHLMWDPRRDDKALVREFLDGYYGAAGPYLLEYLDLVHDAAGRSGVYLRCYMQDTAAWLTPDDVNKATKLFDKAAKAVAGDPLLSLRVRRERMPLDHVWLKRYYLLKRTAETGGTEFLGPKDPVAACEEFIRQAHEFKVGNYREGRPFSDYEEKLRGRFRPPGPPPEECKGLSENDWIDMQDNRFHLASVGKWASIVDDPTASDGKAARMPGNHYEWAVSCPISADLTYGNPWRCYVAVRCEAKTNSGPAMTMGIYDYRTKRGLVSRGVEVKQCAGDKYHTVDLGTHDIGGQMIFWVAPPNRPDEVTAVYVDRIFMIRQKKA